MRISGSGAFEIARRLFRVGGKAPELAVRGMHVGWVVDPSRGDSRVDSAVLLAFPGPRSYTTEDVAEIQGHGGPAVCARVLRLVLAHGARLAGPGEFTRRAFLGGRIDLTQAEAIADLVSARGERALELAVTQLEGNLARAVRLAREECLGLLAGIEAALDFPEDVPESAGSVLAALAACESAIAGLLASADSGALAREGASVAIVGKPNVGKSSLLNALVRADRAIVTSSPGTTRDAVEVGYQLAGIPLLLRDTAGIRVPGDEAEAAGVARSRRHLADADVRMLVIDGSRADEADLALVSEIGGRPSVFVANKADLLAGEPELPAGPDWVLVSALTGAGLPDLERALLGTLPGHGAIGEIAINARHRAALEQALQALQRGRAAAGEGMTVDCVGCDVREAVRFLGGVLGADPGEEVLDVLFSRFCVGK